MALLSIFVSSTFATTLQPSRINGQQVEVLIDPEHKLTVQNIISQKDLNWERSNFEIPSYGFSTHTYWFRFTLPKQKNDSILELDYALLDDIFYYRLQDNKILETIHTGDKRSFSDRPIQHRAFLFPVPASEHSSTILLKIRTSSSVQIPLMLWPDKTFFEQDQYSFVEHGVYYGIALVMILYNLFLFLRLRDSAYGFYVLYVITFAFVQLSLTGFSYQFIWPDSPDWNEKSLAVLTPLIVVSGVVFSSNFLKLDTYHTRLNKLLYIQTFIGIVISALSVFLPYHTMIPYAAGLAIISCITILLLSYYVMLKSMHKYAIYFAAAWSVFLIGVVILAMNKFGLLPRTWVTESAAQIGSAIEIILLSFALAERLYDAMQRHFIAEKESLLVKEELILTQQKQNQILESQVAMRTKDLEAALDKVNTLNSELSDLSTMDQVTGVRNRRYFDNMLDKEFRRAFRNRSNIALIMVDLDHFKKVNDNYGHLAGDLCLKMVANVMYKIVKRPPDLVCRYGGEELAIILPDTDHKGAMVIAERIRHQIENLQIENSDQTISITASLGVASFIPNSHKTPSLLIELADKALYQAKKEGRNCTRYTE
jgi:diguanylate cyclase